MIFVSKGEWEDSTFTKLRSHLENVNSSRILC